MASKAFGTSFTMTTESLECSYRTVKQNTGAENKGKDLLTAILGPTNIIIAKSGSFAERNQLFSKLALD